MVKHNAVAYLLSGMTNNESITKEMNIETKYSVPGPNKGNDKRASRNITKQIQKEFEEVFTGIGCFQWTFSLQVKPEGKPYQAPLQPVPYTLQKQFKEELEKIKKNTGHHCTIRH